MNKNFMDIALKEALKAIEFGDIPVGAIIIKDDKIVSKAHNQKNKSGIATNHAEIIAINKACKKIGNWRLNNCTMYVTLEPCMMCKGAIEEARISKVYYIIPSNYYKNSYKFTKLELVKNGNPKEYQEIVNSFFKNIRK